MESVDSSLSMSISYGDNFIDDIYIYILYYDYINDRILHYIFTISAVYVCILSKTDNGKKWPKMSSTFLRRSRIYCIQEID